MCSAVIRSRNWSLTHNNYTEKDILHYTNFKLKHLVLGKEIGESKTPHLQIHLIYENPKTEQAVIKDHPGAHVTPTRNVTSAIEYCKKEDDYQEHGTPPTDPGNREKKRWKEIRIASEEGRLEDIPDDVRFNSHRTIQAHRNAALLRANYPDTTCTMEWYCGPPGTGKSRKAREENPNAYLKMCNKWWDGYNEEEVVIIEDFDRKHDVLAHHLKIWGDRYQFIGEFKTGARKLRPLRIIITSNYHPEDIWFAPEDLDAILRRFKVTRFGAWEPKENRFIA